MPNTPDVVELERVALPYFDEGFDLLDINAMRNEDHPDWAPYNYGIALRITKTGHIARAILRKTDNLLGQLLALKYLGGSSHIKFSRLQSGDVVVNQVD